MKALAETIDRASAAAGLSGVVSVSTANGAILTKPYGDANKQLHVKNKAETAFGIASGCKLFTAIGICQLIEQGKLSAETKLTECTSAEFPYFPEAITIHQLLTHTSGIADYFDEDEMDDFELLWKEWPMYHMRSPKDFLPLFQQKESKFKPGEHFHYNNAAYIVLGLILEELTNQSFTDYVEKEIFKKAGMTNSGYFELDRLPAHAAIGYIKDEKDNWRTNSYSIPVKGGADGGAFVSAPDMLKLWKALLSFQLISEDMTKLLLQPHVRVNEDMFYGYGVWINKADEEIVKYHVMGYDPGVNFRSSYYPKQKVLLAVTSNEETGAFEITKAVENSWIEGL